MITPRTDAEVAPNDPSGNPGSYVTVDFSRELERELAAALERVKELEGQNEELVSTKKFLLSEINALNKKLWD